MTKEQTSGSLCSEPSCRNKATKEFLERPYCPYCYEFYEFGLSKNSQAYRNSLIQGKPFFDGKSVREDDFMWSPLCGLCQVVCVEEDHITVRDLQRKDLVDFNLDGTFLEGGPRCLFWRPVDYLMHKPYRSVEKEYQFLIRHQGRTFVTSHYFTERLMKEAADKNGYEIIRPIEETERFIYID